MLIIFLIIHGIHFVRWAKRNDYLSFKCFKKLSKKSQKKEQPQADYIHENPHTHSPKLQIRANNNINGRDSTVFSVTGTGKFLMRGGLPNFYKRVFLLIFV